MWDTIFKKKDNTLEEQEKRFEARLAAEQSIAQENYKDCVDELDRTRDSLERQGAKYEELLQKYEELLQTYEVSLAHETILNNQNFELYKENTSLKNLSFPESRFNHKKAIISLMKLTPSSRIALQYQLYQEQKKQGLISELESQVKYLKEHLENGKEI